MNPDRPIGSTLNIVLSSSSEFVAISKHKLIATTGKIKIAHPTDPVIQDANNNTVIEVLTSGVPSGSVKIYGDLIVQGSSSFQNVNTFAVEDPIIDLNFTGSTALSSTDSGFRR